MSRFDRTFLRSFRISDRRTAVPGYEEPLDWLIDYWKLRASLRSIGPDRPDRISSVSFHGVVPPREQDRRRAVVEQPGRIVGDSRIGEPYCGNAGRSTLGNHSDAVIGCYAAFYIQLRRVRAACNSREPDASTPNQTVAGSDCAAALCRYSRGRIVL